jgi:hypothetical protein
MSDISTLRPLNADRVRAALKHCFASKRPVFLWGPPGVGKSDIVAEVTKELALRDKDGNIVKDSALVDIRLNLLEPTDLRGIPYYNRDANGGAGNMSWAAPVDLPTQEFCDQHSVVVLFLDEMNSAPGSVQAAAYQLTLNRKIGQYKLPDNVVIVAAGNRENDKGVTYTMPSPLSNRFIHLEMGVDPEVWINWAVKNKIHQDIIGYISFAKQHLFTFDPRMKQRSFATPRTWAFVDGILQTQENVSHMDERELIDLIGGCIGPGTAVEFMKHREIASKMPNPADILSGKVKKLETNEISAMYTLTISMCYELSSFVEKHAITEDTKNADSKKLYEMADNFFNFMMKNFKTEMCVMGAKVALSTYNLPIDATKLDSFDEFFNKFNTQITNALSLK